MFQIHQLPLAALLAVALSAAACQSQPDSRPTSEDQPAPESGSYSIEEPAMQSVIVNGVTLDANAQARVQQQIGMRLPAGDFWYDGVSGAWGLSGGPALGFTRAGLQLGGALRADASGGGQGVLTGVFVNGRELHPYDVMGLAQFCQVVPGRYWVDAQGNFGYEGLPYAQGNLMQLAQSRNARGSSYLKATPGGYIGSDGETSYFFDPQSGASVIPGEGVSY